MTQVAFDQPWYLVLLALLPLVWRFGWRNIQALAGYRQALALALRSLVFVLFVLALAELQLVRITDRVAALFVLDQSLSVPVEQREQAYSYATVAAAAHRNAAQGDMVGLITFGRDAEVEQPLMDDDLLAPRVESRVNPRHSNLQAALRLARSIFPEGPAKRVVVVSDGNQNLGDAMSEAQLLAENGIGIDAALLPSVTRADVIVEKINVRSAVKIGSPFDISLVLSNYPPPGQSSLTTGRIAITRSRAGQETMVADEHVKFGPGKHVLTFRQELKEPGFYTYQARFIPDNPQGDYTIENNKVTGFTQVHGRGRVLLIENPESPDEFQQLIERLRANDIEVAVRTAAAPFASLVELQDYDSVVLANTPRVTGTGEQSFAQFSDEQIRMLVQNVEQLGAGLVMLGGPDSFGAGGWTNTELERAMPVDFQVKNSEVQATGALLIVIDKSGSMSGLKLQMSKAAAQAAVDMLGVHDQVGVLVFDSDYEEVVRLQPVGGQRDRLKYIIGKIGDGGGTLLKPAMQRGYARLLNADTSVKHMIVLTDGQTGGEGYPEMAADMRRQRISTTTVAVGPDAARNLLVSIAEHGGGKYYQVQSPRAIPQIFMRETRRVLRPLVYESDQAFQPTIVGSHEILRGIAGDLPPLKGYILTTAKPHPLVELPLTSPEPAGRANPLLATWTYGLGRTAVLTTDAGQRWTKAWPEWAHYDQLFVQLIRWSMRPTGDTGDFHVTADVQDGSLRVAVQAITSAGEFLNGLNLVGSVSGVRHGESLPLSFKQISPGGYLAEGNLVDPGSYLISIFPGRGYPLVRTGIDVPALREFRDRETNEHLLVALASLRPREGQHGEVFRLPEDPTNWPHFSGPNVFRRGLPYEPRLTGVWPPVLLLAALLFLVDIVNRRVVLASPWQRLVEAVQSRIGRGKISPEEDLRLERLKSQKESLWRDRRPATESAAPAVEGMAVEPAEVATASVPPPTSAEPPLETGPDNYTSRLLRAKRAARDGKNP